MIPESIKKDMLHGVHEGIGGGHLGVEKTVAKLKNASIGLDIIVMCRIGVLLLTVALHRNQTATSEG